MEKSEFDFVRQLWVTQQLTRSSSPTFGGGYAREQSRSLVSVYAFTVDRSLTRILSPYIQYQRDFISCRSSVTLMSDNSRRICIAFPYLRIASNACRCFLRCFRAAALALPPFLDNSRCFCFSMLSNDLRLSRHLGLYIRSPSLIVLICNDNALCCISVCLCYNLSIIHKMQIWGILVDV